MTPIECPVCEILMVPWPGRQDRFICPECRSQAILYRSSPQPGSPGSDTVDDRDMGKVHSYQNRD